MEIAENKTKRPLISLTPLIDVVFILLVFFMLTSSFINWNYITLGVDQAETLSDPLAQQSFIKISANGIYQLNEKNVSFTELITQLEKKIHQKKDHLVLVQPHELLPLQKLVIVLDKLNEISVTNLSLVKDER